MSPRRIVMDEVLCHFSKLEDPRSTVNRKHPLASVIVIAILGVLAGASGPTGIATWAAIHADALKKLVPLPNGVPRKDVFRRLFCALKPGIFQACFSEWIETLREAASEATGEDRPVLAVDGKTLRRSHDRLNGLKALHTVSVWASEYGLSLAQVATPETGNEITAIPEVLAQVELKEAIVTIDAIGTQKEIAEQIVASGGDYVLALKDNQGKLKANVIEYVTQQFDNGLADGQVRRVVMKSRGHGREETREVFQFAAPAELTNSGDWRGLATIGFVKLTTVRAGKTTEQVRYFISSLPLGVKTFARAIRSHWRIENSCHWVLDVTYREDESRTREKSARENFAWLYRFTLSLLKQHPSKQSLAMKRRACGWSIEFLTGRRDGDHN